MAKAAVAAGVMTTTPLVVAATRLPETGMVAATGLAVLEVVAMALAVGVSAAAKAEAGVTKAKRRGKR